VTYIEDRKRRGRRLFRKVSLRPLPLALFSQPSQPSQHFHSL
jgi:hypothetical protein